MWALWSINHLSFLTLLFETGLPLNSTQRNLHEKLGSVTFKRC